jgi:hypothetical protein
VSASLPSARRHETYESKHALTVASPPSVVAASADCVLVVSDVVEPPQPEYAVMASVIRHVARGKFDRDMFVHLTEPMWWCS